MVEGASSPNPPWQPMASPPSLPPSPPGWNLPQTLMALCFGAAALTLAPWIWGRSPAPEPTVEAGENSLAIVQITPPPQDPPQAQPPQGLWPRLGARVKDNPPDDRPRDRPPTLGNSLGDPSPRSNPVWANFWADFWGQPRPHPLTPSSSSVPPSPLSPEPSTQPQPTPSASPEPILKPIPELIVDLSDRRLYWYIGQQLHRSYPIAIGQEGWETPLGIFHVLYKRENPSWRHPILRDTVIPPGPDNPLGAAWIGFFVNGQQHIGFHGTPQEELLGQAVSHGCIRMRNPDILELYQAVELGWVVRVRS